MELPHQFHRRDVPPFASIKPEREKLPAYAQRRTILDTIARNRVVLICGGTGCGKTTQIPQYILENCSDLNQRCKIICTQPRKLATISIARRVAQERAESMPAAVGYQVRSDCCLKPNTALIFMTRWKQ